MCPLKWTVANYSIKNEDGLRSVDDKLITDLLMLDRFFIALNYDVMQKCNLMIDCSDLCSDYS